MRIVLITADNECAKCREAKDVLAKVAQRFPWVEVETLKTSEPAAASYGPVMSPTVIVDNIIITSGRAPSESKLVAYIEQLNPRQ